MRAFIRGAGRGLLSIFFPPVCPACDRRVGGPSFPCPECDGRLRVLWDELASLPEVPGLVAALPFAGAARELVHRMKYRGHLSAADLLARLMAARLAAEARFAASPVLVPVPLHPTKLRQRGFNQAERLARSIGVLADLEVRPHLLRRTRAAGSQTARRQEDRRAAVAGAFRVRRPPPDGVPVILVDDVWTTGATAESCRCALLETGAPPEVVVLVAARTPARLPI